MIPNELELMITRVFNVPWETVFKGWTEPTHVLHWRGPSQFTAPFCQIDFREGGFHLCMQAPDGKKYWNQGVYREIVVPEKIVSVMDFSDAPGNTLKPTDYGIGPDFPSEVNDTVTFRRWEGHKT